MFVAELKEIAKERHSGDFRKVLDLGDIRAIQVADDKVYCREDSNGNGLKGHDNFNYIYVDTYI
jgi:hypothetical protein